jgi:predicted Abi (CAAX) family protease
VLVIDPVSTGIILLTFVAVAYGGTFLLRLSTKGGCNDLQRAWFRAGHAHAGVLLTLGLVVRILTGLPGVAEWARTGGAFVLYAAILMPLGFFLGVLGKDPTRPNAWKYSIWAGAASLVIGVVSAGVGLLLAG